VSAGPGGTPLSDLSAFVGDLPFDVGDEVLRATFMARFATVTSAKVMTDTVTGESKGYGFVKFSNKEDRDRCVAAAAAAVLSLPLL
jgi:RNA recognition motif-containing protein